MKIERPSYSQFIGSISSKVLIWRPSILFFWFAKISPFQKNMKAFLVNFFSLPFALCLETSVGLLSSPLLHVVQRLNYCPSYTCTKPPPPTAPNPPSPPRRASETLRHRRLQGNLCSSLEHHHYPNHYTHTVQSVQLITTSITPATSV